MMTFDLWTMSYDELSKMRIRALVRLSNEKLSKDEREALRRICVVWTTRSNLECI